MDHGSEPRRWPSLITRRPAEERWTHYWIWRDDYKQLDYLLLSKSLAEASDGDPEIMRKGIPKKATAYKGERFPGVGRRSPELLITARSSWTLAWPPEHGCLGNSRRQGSNYCTSTARSPSASAIAGKRSGDGSRRRLALASVGGQ